MNDIFNLLINEKQVHTNIKGYENTILKGGCVLFNKKFGLRVLIIIKSTEKRNLICGYSIKRNTIIKANNQDILETLIYLKNTNSELANEIDINVIENLFKKNNKKILIVNKNLSIYSEENKKIEENETINCHLNISNSKLEIQEFTYHISRKNQICTIRCNSEITKDKLIYLGDEFDLVIGDTEEVSTRLKCKKYWNNDDCMNLICLNALFYNLSKFKNDFLYVEQPAQVVNDNIMHFMLRSAGLDNENINCEVTRQDTITAYKIILLISNTELDNEIGYSYIKFYSNKSGTSELKRFKQKLDEASYCYDKCCFAEVIVNAKSLYDAYMQAKELLIKTFQVMKFIIRNNIINNENINLWNRSIEDWNVEISKWAYIECVPYKQIIIGHIDTICIYNNMCISNDEKNKLSANKSTFACLLDKNIGEDKRNILRAVKWVNKSWDSNEFEEKILYTVIAMEFLIVNIPDTSLLNKQNINKIKKYVKTELEINQDIISKVNEKISNSLTMSPMMNKFNQLLNYLKINLEDEEIEIIKNIRKVRNDITHGREYNPISYQEIDKVNSILILIVKRALEV